MTDESDYEDDCVFLLALFLILVDGVFFSALATSDTFVAVTPPSMLPLSVDRLTEARPVVALLLLLLFGVFFTEPVPLSLPTSTPTVPPCFTPEELPLTAEELLSMPLTAEEASFFSFRDATARAFFAALFSCVAAKQQ